jgi:Transglycosylase SLT domain
MATPIATAFVRIRPDTTGFGKEVKQDVDKAGHGLAQQGKRHGRVFGTTFAKATAGPFRSIGGVFASSIGGLATGFAAVAGIKVFAGFVADARESNKIARITAQAIKSTGGAANVTAGQVGKLAEAISNKTGKDDEAIQSGQNLLLTFTNIRNETGKGNDIFNQASQAIVDMTAALNNGEVSSSGLKASSIQLGKALNDPIKGVTALRKVGVSFTEQQTKQIKKLVEAGRTLDAQKIILRELGKEFGGAAAASTDPMEKLRVIVGNLGEKIGNVLLPFLTTAATVIANKVIPTVGKFVDGLSKRATPAVSAIAGFIKGTLIPAIKALAGFIVTQIVPAVKKWFGILAKALQPALDALGEAWKQDIKPALKGLFDAIQRNWPAFKRLATIVLVVVGAILKFLLPVLIRVAGVLVRLFILRITLSIKALGLLIRWLITAGKAVGAFAVATARYFTQWYQAARTAVQNVVDFFRKLPGRISRAVGGLGKLLYNKGRQVVTGFWNGVKDVWASVISWFKGLPKRILNALGIHSPPKWAIDAGRHIMAGLLKGMVPGGKDLLAFGKNVVAGLSATMGGPQLRFGGGGGAISGSAVQIGQKMAALVGWTGAQWRALYDLWNNESGWNPLADNPTSTAFGIPQFIKSTAQAYGVYGSTDPSRQIAAGLQYIADRYGDPLHAWAHWTAHHSYDAGGWLMPGATLAVNKTGRPERVLGPRESYGNSYTINIAVPAAANQHEIGRLTVNAIKAYERGSGAGWRK